jgi:predicted nucleic acid-binding protein
LFEQLTNAPPARFYVRDLFLTEGTNISCKYVRRFGYPADAAQWDVHDLTRLPIQIVSTASLAAEGALILEVEYGATAYDSAHVALPRRLSLPLVTGDEALVDRFAEGDAEVRFVGDWPEGAAGRS